MKLCRFELKESPGEVRSGLVYGGKVYETQGSEPVAVHEAADVRPLVPVVPPSVRIYRNAGLRDVDRWSESDIEAAPFFYANAANLYGPSIVLPYPVYSADLDWEAYLGIVVGEAGRNIGPGEADAYILGFTMAVAVVARDVARRDQAVGVEYGRGYDVGIIVGPVVSTPDDISDQGEPTDLGTVYRLAATSRVNEVERRRGDTGELPYTVAQFVSFASESSLIRPGDLILAGPIVQPDATRLEPGDEVKVSVENLGTLSVKLST